MRVCSELVSQGSCLAYGVGNEGYLKVFDQFCTEYCAPELYRCPKRYRMAPIFQTIMKGVEDGYRRSICSRNCWPQSTAVTQCECVNTRTMGFGSGRWSSISLWGEPAFLEPGLLMAAGGGLLHRAVTGQCQLYRALKVNTAERGDNGVTSVHHGEGIKVEHSLAIDRSPEELYRFWRNVENLPSFMRNLDSVRILGDGRSHWVVRAPTGKTVEWDAEIHNEIENELIAWRSLEGADINNAGSVRFRRLPGGGTEVKVTMSFEPPFGRFGLEIAKLLGEDPAQQLQDDLRRFKQMMEIGGPSDEIKQRSI